MNAVTTAQARIAEAGPRDCPFCGDRNDGHLEDAIHNAAHCCLWHEFDHTARVRIANRVEAGVELARRH